MSLPASAGEARSGKILRSGHRGSSAGSDLPRGKVLRAVPPEREEREKRGAVSQLMPEKRRSRLSLIVPPGRVKFGHGAAAFFAVCVVFVGTFVLVPSSLESATAFVVSRHERLLSSVSLLAKDYERLRREPEMEQPVVEATQRKTVEGATSRWGGAVVESRRVRETTSYEPRVVDRPVSSLALLNKVHHIIKEHAPRHRSSRELAEAIIAESAAQNFDPLFVAAVIKSESTFNAMARSHVGAQGLMQIMPKTGAWLAAKEESSRGRLTDPGYNLKLGIRYLKYLEGLYGGNRMFSLIAYNWGPGRVESAADGKRRVPPEVTTYALKILKDYRRWRADVYL
jgi:soluble lytic murein transglycosylase